MDGKIVPDHHKVLKVVRGDQAQHWTDDTIRVLFVISTLVTAEAMCGYGHGPRTAADPRFASHLDQTSRMMLTMAGGNFPLGAGAHVEATAPAAALRALHDRGVPILAGADAGTLGVAHGASLHRELQLLTEAGLSPAEALTAATAAPAARFGLSDRGRIAPGLTADLMLVDGDPTTDISATASIYATWRRGTRHNR
ncbi:MAG: amidohydrolase family protein [Trebonia sp.]